MENLKDKLYVRKRGAFIWALALSIGMAASVPMIVVGFVLKGGFIAMAILGIVLAVSGFYGGPLVWIYFGVLKYYSNVKRQIVSENIHSVKMLSELHNKKPEIMANDIKTMVQKNYLPGFILLDNEKIIDRASMNKHEYEVLEAERAGALSLVHCPYCNAKFAMILDVEECPYCKSHITRDMVYGKPATNEADSNNKNNNSHKN